MRNHKRKLRDV